MKNTDHPSTATEAQINANRQNAQKSTGPRTSEGKDASSRNRLLHGLRANKHILLDEDPAEFLFLLHDHLDRFQPVGPGEETLVLRIANDQWRLRRAFTMEPGIHRDRFHDVAQKEEFRQQQYTTKKGYAEQDGEPVPPPPTPPDEGDLLARAFNVDCEGPNSFTKLARYESSIERSVDRCLRQLQKYQGARNASTPGPGHPPSPPPEEPLNPETPETDAAPPPETGATSAATPAATPSKNRNYHSNPKNGGIAQAGVPSGSAAFVLVMYALLHAVPALIAALGSLLADPRIGHKYREMNTFHRLSAARPAPNGLILRQLGRPFRQALPPAITTISHQPGYPPGPARPDAASQNLTPSTQHRRAERG